jgi:two-component system, OmpR family, sensor kinase
MPASSPSPDRLLMTLQQLLAFEALDLPTALTQVATLITDLLPAEKVDVLLYDPTIDSLVAVGVSQTPLGLRERQLGLDRLPLSNKGRTVMVFESGDPYMTNHADRDPTILPGFRDGLGLRSMLLTPLLVQGERRGVLGVSTTVPESYTTTDLDFLTTVAQWIGLVVHRAELTEQLRLEVATTAHQRAATELMNVLAHDLGNYLMPIQGRLLLVRQRCARDGRERDLRDLDAALAAVDRVQRLAQDLLDSERISQGVFHLTLSLFDLMPPLRDTVTALDSPDHPITLAGPEDLCLQADTSRLRQAVENVLTNALKHTPTGVPISIACAPERRPDGWWAVIRIHDQGPGIPPAVLPTVMQRFVSHGSQGGLGMGLHLVHGIVQAHHGTLTLDSAPGQGTTVTLAIPGADPDPTMCGG